MFCLQDFLLSLVILFLSFLVFIGSFYTTELYSLLLEYHVYLVYLFSFFLILSIFLFIYKSFKKNKKKTIFFIFYCFLFFLLIYILWVTNFYLNILFFGIKSIQTVKRCIYDLYLTISFTAFVDDFILIIIETIDTFPFLYNLLKEIIIKWGYLYSLTLFLWYLQGLIIFCILTIFYKKIVNFLF